MEEKFHNHPAPDPKICLCWNCGKPPYRANHVVKPKFEIGDGEDREIQFTVCRHCVKECVFVFDEQTNVPISTRKPTEYEASQFAKVPEILAMKQRFYIINAVGMKLPD